MSLTKLFIQNLVNENIEKGIILSGKDYEKFTKITRERGLIAGEVDFNYYLDLQFNKNIRKEF